jgi:UDP-glucose 4-epimerase
MKNTVVVLGGSGFIGGHVCQHFAGLGWRVVCVGRGAGHPAAHLFLPLELPTPGLSQILTEEKPSLLLNAAGRANVALSVRDPWGDFKVTPGITMECLEALRTTLPECAYVTFSSASVYGNPPSLPVSEQASLRPVSPYGYHKQMEELACAEYAQLYGLRTCALRVFSAYGERLHRQVVWDLSKRIAGARGRPVRVLGTGLESRDFIHGEDVARAVESVFMAGRLQGAAINVANGEEVLIRDLAGTIRDALGSNCPIEFDGKSPEGYPLRWHADIRVLRACGFKSTVGLPEGIVRVCRAARIGE